MSPASIGSLHLTKQVSIYIVFFAALASLSLAACQQSAPPPTPAPPVAVRTVPVRLGPVREQIDYVGTVHSQREVRVLARVSGTLLELPVHEGDAVRKGDVIALVSAPEAHARVRHGAADVSRATTESSYLCERFETDRRLATANVLTPAQLDASRKACEASQASVRAAEAGLFEIRSVAAKSTESAPFSGRVLQWLAEPGEHVMPGRPILLLGDDELEVRVPVAESDVERGLSKDGRVELRRGSGAAVTSTIRSIAPLAMGPGRTVEVRISIPETGRLSHGQSVDVGFVTAERTDAVLVPTEAVHRGDDGFALFLVSGGRAQRFAVVLGPREDGWVAVTPPPSKDAHVAVSGLDQLHDGASVYAVDAVRVVR